MRGLRAVDGERIIERRLIAGRPVLGICVGMQILFAEGIEHGVRSTGLRRVARHGREAPGADRAAHGLGHRRAAGRLGDVRRHRVRALLLRALLRRARVACSTPRRTAFKAPGVTWTEYGGDRFVSAVEHGPLWATQFHPEKSGDAGRRLLRELDRHAAGERVRRGSAPAGG